MKTLQELARLVGGSVKGDPRTVVEGVNGLREAGPREIAFLTASHHRRHPDFATEAGALVVPPDLEDLDGPLLIASNPYEAFARIAQAFASPPFLETGVHPRAFVAEDALLGPEVRVGPLAHIGKGCEIGEGSRIYGSAYLGSDVRVGRHCLVHPNATILDGSRLGDRVIVHAGAVVGSDGFGFAQDAQGRHVKIPQQGFVQIDDDVEIGAGCTIDRATFGKTWIREGCKLDNLVHVAHNVTVGEHSILVAQVGISGSVRLGSRVMMGGQAGVVGHVEIGDGARVAAKAGVGRSVKPGEDVMGIPAVTQKEWLRAYGDFRRLPRLKEELRRLEKRLLQLEGAVKGQDDD